MTIESKFGLGRADGVHFSDPREFFRALHPDDRLGIYDSAGTRTVSTAAGFYTEVAKRGTNDDTNWSAATKKTILSVTGSGLVANIGGPSGLAGTPTTVFEITVDGTLYSDISVVATTTGQRAVLGAVIPDLGGTGVLFTTAKIAIEGPPSVSAAKDVEVFTAVEQSLPPWNFMRLFATPCLIFRQSLLIRMSSSEANSTTAANQRQSFVQYMVQS